MRVRFTYRLAIVFAALFGVAAQADGAGAAQEDALFQDGVTADLADFVWTKRPVVVFADSPNDPRFIQQLELLRAEPEALRDLDIVVLYDTAVATGSALRTTLRPRGFMMVLIGKDGGVKLRKPIPWNVREISRVIDKMPMRQQEIEDRRAGAAGE